MSKAVVITASAELIPEQCDLFIKEFEKARASVRDQEPDCYVYDLHVSPTTTEGKKSLLIYEVYKDQATLDFHNKSQGRATVNAFFAEYPTKVTVKQYERLNKLRD